jgi:hypothetical protein
MSTLRVNALANAAGTAVASMTAGTLTLEAGSTSRPPLVLQAGSTLTTPQAGAFEYNGRVFVVTPDATSGKAFNTADHFYGMAADTTLIATVVAGTFYPVFGVGLDVANDATYAVEMLVGLRTGATSHTISFHFGGTATISEAQFRTEFTNLAISTGAAAAGTPTAPVSLMFSSNAALPANCIISPASTLTSKFFRVSGLISVSTGGTIVPEISFSANPTGTNQVTRLSYVRLAAIGTATGALVAGNWV